MVTAAAPACSNSATTLGALIFFSDSPVQSTHVQKQHRMAFEDGRWQHKRVSAAPWAHHQIFSFNSPAEVMLQVRRQT
jgi:hypothetical protein